MSRQAHLLVEAFDAVKGSDGATKRRSVARQRDNHCVIIKARKKSAMAKGNQKGNREAKKPKKEKIKTIAAAPSQKTGGWQPALGSSKKK